MHNAYGKQRKNYHGVDSLCSPDISRHNAVTRAAMQNLWQSDLEIQNLHLHQAVSWSLSAVLGSYQRCVQDWCSQSMVSAKAIGNQMVPSYVEWWCEMGNQAITPFSYCPSTVFLPVRPHCTNARWNRCPDLNSFPLGELEETNQDTLVLRGWRLSSRTWNPITSPEWSN